MEKADNGIYLNRSSTVGDFMDILECPICLGIVQQPCECSSCQRLFCEKQINKLQHKKCPLCKKDEWKRGTEIHLAYRRALTQLKFKCDHPNCNHAQPLLYQEYIEHLKTLESKPILPTSVGSQPQQPKIPFYQYFSIIDNVSAPFPERVNYLINYRRMEGYKNFMIGPQKAVNLMTGQLTNLADNSRSPIQSRIVQSHQQRIRWLFKRLDDIQFMEQTMSDYLQQNYRQYKLTGAQRLVNYMVGKWNYMADLVDMVQTNLSTQKKRQLWRVVI